MNPPWSPARPAFGTWLKVPAPEVVEVLASSGLDFVVIDTEHAAFDVRTTSTMISVARSYGIPAFVRVPGHTARDVQPALDAGAAGLFVPHVDSVDDAREVVGACRFPPEGRRGASLLTRAGGWGQLKPAFYTDHGNRGVTLVAQLESPEAVTGAVSIAEVAGIDAVFIGSFDLAVAAGLEPGGEAAQELVQHAETVCRSAGVNFGRAAATGADAAASLSRGHQFVMVASDAAFLAMSACENVAEARVGIHSGAALPCETALIRGESG
ncbi:HpcH/HpaI aldolase family protein [Streptomyces sp. NBC_00063]|uniref:HpcH/HpaI aldolase family protein n=1 Tax=Streptomyces sp. NBC_00063 TaxID=2975638 RepID=UPI003D70F0B5